MNTRTILLLALAIPTATFAAALYFQYFEGMAPCELCVWQRIAQGAGMAGVALALLTVGAMRGAFSALGGLGFLSETGIAAFHTGVERRWWEGLPGCSANSLGSDFSASGLANMMDNVVVARCDDIPWSLFGLSMANYNVVISLGLAALCFCAAKRVYGSNSTSQ